MYGLIIILQLNKDDEDNLADDVSASDCDEAPAAKPSPSPLKTKKKRRKKAKDKSSSSDAKAAVFLYSLF